MATLVPCSNLRLQLFDRKRTCCNLVNINEHYLCLALFLSRPLRTLESMEFTDSRQRLQSHSLSSSHTYTHTEEHTLPRILLVRFPLQLVSSSLLMSKGVKKIAEREKVIYVINFKDIIHLSSTNHKGYNH